MAYSGGDAPFWHLAPDEALRFLETSEHGLTTEEALRRLARFGANRLEAAAKTTVGRIALRQFASPLIALLVAAATIAAALDELVDAAVIAFALVLNAVIGFTQELRAERSTDALQRLARSLARVVRDGRERQLDAEALVPGDIVLIEAGAKVPADCRLLHATALEIDESTLTGESAPVAKRVDPAPRDAALPDRSSMLFLGTVVTRGHCRAVVTSTGARTELGQIAGSMRELSDEQTPLQRRMSRFARLIGAVVLGSCALGFLAGIVTGERPDELLLALVALAVAAIPEGLPIVLTVALAISMRRMASRRAIIRRLPAVETLGSCTAIGSDKTGTLTQNRMTVRSIWLSNAHYELTGTGLESEGALTLAGERVAVTQGSPLELALLAVVLCNDATAVPRNGAFDVAGDPTEVALLVAAAKAGLFKDELEESYPRLAEIPFDPALRYMATLNRTERGAALFVKGAPEQVLALCERDLTSASLLKEQILEAAASMASEGMRVLAAGSRALDGKPLSLEAPHTSLDGLTFLALFGMIDPPRHEAIEAVRGCQEAGIRVVMITGDHGATASAIAAQLGIAEPGARAVTGSELDAITDDELDALVEQSSVFARVSPQHKLSIVRSLKRAGHIVAVTGDGVNDGPALRAADIGVAMGLSGTDVAKEAADMVVTDDNFATVVAAVEEGRVAFDNVRKTTFFLISTGAASIIAVLASIFGQFAVPFVAAQMIWLNLVTNGIQDVALAFEPGERDVLRRQPRPPGEGVISSLLWERTVLAGLVMAAGTLGLFLHELHSSDDVDRARTVALTTMVLFQVFHVGNARSEHLSAFAKSPFSNKFLFLGTAAALSLHVGTMHFGPAQVALRLEPLDIGTWLIMLGVAASVIAVTELHKLLRGSRRKHEP